jgi:hypothetical protein
MQRTETIDLTKLEHDPCYRMAGFADEHMLRLGDIPHLEAAQEMLWDFWLENLDAQDAFGEESVGVTYAMMLSEITHTVLLAENPFLALRKKLVSSVYHLARYLVLTIPLEPEKTDTDSRRPDIGVTGELSSFVPNIVEACDDLRNWELLTYRDTVSSDIAAELNQRQLYWTARYQIFRHLIRLYERNTPEAANWLTPALEGSCSMWEHTYRELLGLKPALRGGRSEKLYVYYSSLLSRAAAGVANPLDA